MLPPLTMSTGKIIGLTLLALIVLLALFWGGLYLRRYVFTLKRTAVKQSLPYQEGKTALLMQQAEEWWKLEAKKNETSDAKLQRIYASQQAYLVSRMRLEAERLNWKNIPPSVMEIVR